MASASTSAAANSESEERDFTNVESDEGAEWVNAPFFPVEHILHEYKSQAKKAMKEPIIEDLTHEKISSAFMEILKLQMMQYLSLHSDLGTVKDETESTRTKQIELFDQRLPAYTMMQVDKKLNEESKIGSRMNKLESRVEKVEEKLQLLVNQVVITNETLLKLLEA